MIKDTEDKPVREERKSPATSAVDSAPQDIIITAKMLRAGIILVFVMVILGLILTDLSGATPSRSPASVQTAVPAMPGQPTGQRVVNIDLAALVQQVNPANGYTLPVKWGALGPALVRTGAIDYEPFVKLYEDMNHPLTEQQHAILKQGSDAFVTIDAHSAHFMLNFFWAVGLVNENPILTQGRMMQNGRDQVGNFASTGGWTLGSKTATALYASVPLIPLTTAQQTRLERVAQNVYRPCCPNATTFPDCNHGMAMLGLLALMASQNATEDEMFTAAKYVNAFWFPQQMLEVAIYAKARQNLDFTNLDPHEAVGAGAFSSEGFNTIHQWLAINQLLPGTQSGGSCGVK